MPKGRQPRSGHPGIRVKQLPTTLEPLVELYAHNRDYSVDKRARYVAEEGYRRAALAKAA